jgi:hypothetical protein
MESLQSNRKEKQVRMLTRLARWRSQVWVRAVWAGLMNDSQPLLGTDWAEEAIGEAAGDRGWRGQAGPGIGPGRGQVDCVSPGGQGRTLERCLRPHMCTHTHESIYSWHTLWRIWDLTVRWRDNRFQRVILSHNGLFRIYSPPIEAYPPPRLLLHTLCSGWSTDQPGEARGLGILRF